MGREDSCIKFGNWSWDCPACGKRRRVKDTGKDERIVRCCGMKFRITTEAYIRKMYTIRIIDVCEDKVV